MKAMRYALVTAVAIMLGLSSTATLAAKKIKKPIVYDKWYVDAALLGSLVVDGDFDNAAGFEFGVAYYVDPNVRVQASYIDFGDFDSEDVDNLEVSVTGYELSLTGQTVYSNDIGFEVMAGFVDWESDGQRGSVSFDGFDDGTSFMMGLGASWGGKSGVGVSTTTKYYFDISETDLLTIDLGVFFRF